ncbi:hypothetical protein MMC13_007685 [Lambiella insularis]|nr:hypothetical protein [Lambiella insularis]
MSVYTPRSRPSMRNLSSSTFTTTTPTMRRTSGVGGGEELRVGDTVDVTGGMDGLVKFVGEVRGKPGIFVGVELSQKWAARGKNDGDADGIKYFTTSTPGSGVFLPIARATKRASPGPSIGSFPPTPTTETMSPKPNGSSMQTPPTPSLAPNFSRSVGPGRAPSPVLRPKSRPSLPRPESPLRRTKNASAATPGGNRPSVNMHTNNRLGGPRLTAPSPTPGKMAKRISKVSNSYGSPAPSKTNGKMVPPKDESDEVVQLRAAIQEKNDKIAVMTAEFDSHRADFRSTLDTLELASTETERVYERKVEDLMEERRVLIAQSEDVDSVAHQLRQLEEVVQELEEGLEDARRGEAEARGEVEFLRGEVERVRAELRREKEKNQDLELERSRDKKRERAYHTDREPTHEIEKEPEHKVPSEETDDHIRETESEQDYEFEVEELPPAEKRESAPKTNGAFQAPAVEQTADADKWCALCEQDGHDSISCPLDG